MPALFNVSATCLFKAFSLTSGLCLPSAIHCVQKQSDNNFYIDTHTNVYVYVVCDVYVLALVGVLVEARDQL